MVSIDDASGAEMLLGEVQIFGQERSHLGFTSGAEVAHVVVAVGKLITTNASGIGWRKSLIQI